MPNRALVLLAALAAAPVALAADGADAGNSYLWQATFFGIVALLIALVGILAWLGLSNHPYALGLPNGSVRALLAVGLVVIFVGLGYQFVAKTPLSAKLVEVRPVENQTAAELDALAMQLGDEFVLIREATGQTRPGEAPKDPAQPLFKATVYMRDPSARTDLVRQLLTTLATALSTVVGFYFGSRSLSPPGSSGEDPDSIERVVTTKQAREMAEKRVEEAKRAATRADKALEAAKARASADGLSDEQREMLQVDVEAAAKASRDAAAALADVEKKAKQVAAIEARTADGDPAAQKAAVEEARALLVEIEKRAANAQTAATKAEGALRRAQSPSEPA